MLLVKYSNKDTDSADYETSGYSIKIDGNIEADQILESVIMPLLKYLDFTLEEVLVTSEEKPEKRNKATKEKYENV